MTGYDGSDHSLQALEWAMDEAELRRLPLTVVHAWQWPYGEAGEDAGDRGRAAAGRVLRHGADCARACSTIVEVATDLYEGPAARRLVELSADAELVVIGSRGRNAPARSVIGSTASAVAAHARAPVLITRGTGPIPVPLHPGPVVLGLKDTTGGEVLEFAFEEAALRRLRLLVMHAGHPHHLTAWGVAMAPLPDVDDSARVCREWVDERLAGWQEKYPKVAVDVCLSTTAPKESLLDASAKATLLVAGAGRSALLSGHLGLMTRSLVRHASGPVAVVPPAAGPAGPGGSLRADLSGSGPPTADPRQHGSPGSMSPGAGDRGR
ncbi:universal stress protein [Streptosporangium sandarakinum]